MKNRTLRYLGDCKKIKKIWYAPIQVSYLEDACNFYASHIRDLEKETYDKDDTIKSILDDFIDYKISSTSDTYRVLYEAEISEADATINIYLEHPVAIGEHPQHIDEVNKLVDKIAQAKEKIEVLEEFEPERSVL